MIRKTIHNELLKRLREKRRFMQVLAGPRQVGKTTVVRQVMEAVKIPSHYASADEPTLRDRTWLRQQWDIGRLKAQESKIGALLVLDEIQKVPSWSRVVKLLWDADTHSGMNLKVVLLGSSPLLIQSGLTESLAGRFEVIIAPHWSFTEMREAFGWNLEQYIFYGAYPGAAELIHDPERWRRYILDSLIETTISRDILLLTRVDKPALLRRLFQLGCAYSGQILSYQKMIGQLTDAGNTTTLAHYLQLLQGAGMLAGLAKYFHSQVRHRGSSPKLQVLNTALMSAQDHRSITEARRDGDYWGRLVESCIGSHLCNSTLGTNSNVTYWRERNHEVDFVLQQGKTVIAIEVKSGARREILPGMDAFVRLFKPKRQLLVGEQGIEVEEFLTKPAAHWLE
ncbi:MAG TPA: ATP-binding protein [Phycisphaerae bacterium]|nr:ATP-binding protein [Phycisphaerae bacterium]